MRKPKTFPYFPHTEEDIRQMLSKCGLSSMRELYSDVPDECFYDGEYNLPSAMSELELKRHLETLASMNTRLKIFVGAGAYDHYCPAVVPYILSRSEFSTAYTPYQAEISQGTLRAIFEWQTMICRITGMDVANASMYDGATAAAEAMMMCAASVRKRNRFLISATMLPQVIDVVSTYARYHGIDLVVVPEDDGITSIEELKLALNSDEVAGVMLPGINRYGVIENLDEAVSLSHAAGALFVEYCDPSAMTVLKTAGEYGADIACGDAQSLGMPLAFGGPYAGFMACKKDYMRKLPGRLVGQTVDVDGKRAFVLTLQAREQHIRREKATSNICSNQSLMALYATVYLSLMGPEGMKEVNELSYSGAHYLKSELLKTGYFEEAFSTERPFLKEFVIRPVVPVENLQAKLAERGFFAACDMGNGLLGFCVTEKHDKIECDSLVAAVKSVLDIMGGES